jgi:hypothetical protein
MEISNKALEALQAMESGAVLWTEVMERCVEGYGEISWETLHELLEAQLIERQAEKIVGHLSMPYVITASGRRALAGPAPDDTLGH